MNARAWAQLLPVVSVLMIAPAQAQDLSFTEEFVDVPSLSGWVMINRSDLAGTVDWFQGNPVVFDAHSGEADEYIAAAGSEISLWLISPEIPFELTSTLAFWTRTPALSSFPDGLQVRMSTAGASTDVGATSTSVGVFSNLVLEINSTLAVAG